MFSWQSFIFAKQNYFQIKNKIFLFFQVQINDIVVDVKFDNIVLQGKTWFPKLPFISGLKMDAKDR